MEKTYESSSWSLADLFPGIESPEMQQAFAELESQVEAFTKQRALLKPEMSIQEFAGLIRDMEAITRLGNRIHAFAALKFAENTMDQAIQAFYGRVDQFLTELQNRILFFEIWWKELDEENARRLMDSTGDYRYWLEKMRLFKPHTLSEAEEKIINIKNVTGANAMAILYDSITNRYSFKLRLDDLEQELTRGELMVYARHHDPDLRAAAYQELYRVYGQDGPILGQIYQTLVRDWRNEQMELRHFPSPISARNLMNDIPDEVVNTLLQVSEENAAIFQRYFQLKARWLGMDRLRRYDIYAPVAKADKEYAFPTAANMVLEAFQNFDRRVADQAQRVFDEKHLDSEVRKGKRSGAFCATITPDLTPWVLVNYQKRPDDVATLAHELGHAIHSMQAEQHSVFTQQASLPLAETASTFGEMMLIDLLLEREEDAGVRRDLLFRQVDDAYATIMRQVFFALFERQAHEMVIQGAAVDELSIAYLDNLKAQFGDVVDVTDEFRWEWVSIPHIYHVPFYVYAYAFGQLLVLSLYQQYKSEGETFKPRYLKILSSGGSAAPAKILAEAGIDIYQAEFWQGGFDAIRRMIDQLETIPIIRA